MKKYQRAGNGVHNNEKESLAAAPFPRHYAVIHYLVYCLEFLPFLKYTHKSRQKNPRNDK